MWGGQWSAKNGATLAIAGTRFGALSKGDTMLTKAFLRPTAMAVAVTITLTSCTTMGTGGNGGPRTALDRSINQCIASVLVGALAGALIGSATGKRNVGKGAMIGAGGGLVVCAVILAVNNAEDRKHIQQAQALALNTNRPYQDQYTGPDGQPHIVKASFGTQDMPFQTQTSLPSPDGGVFVGPCRTLSTEISTPAGTSQLGDQYCRTSLGSWQLRPNGAV